MFKQLVQSALVLGISAAGPPAYALVNCSDRAEVTDMLVSDYGEQMQAIGLQSQNQLVEVWSSAATGSWTILVTDSQGKTCMLANGIGFESHFPESLIEKVSARP